MECIFCKIASGEVGAKVLYENEGAVAFLDVNPLSAGHTLVVPKKHAAKAHELDEASWGAVAGALAHVSRLLVKKLGVDDYNILQNNGRIAGQVVQHVHFHVIPRTATTGLELVWRSTELDIGEVYKKLKG